MNQQFKTTNKMERLIAYTNARLSKWYSDVKKDYDVIGSGFSKFNKETNELEIYYTENGINCCFRQYFYDDFKINTIFDIWQESANPENDKI